MKYPKRIHIPDYQRGVKFVGGAYAGVTMPGSYLTFGDKEQINLIDMRPYLVLVERLTFFDVLHAPCVASFGAKLRVLDPYIAATRSKDHLNDSIGIVRNAALSVLSRALIVAGLDMRARLSTDIKLAVNKELLRVGMELSEIEITELWTDAKPPATSVGQTD